MEPVSRRVGTIASALYLLTLGNPGCKRDSSEGDAVPERTAQAEPAKSPRVESPDAAPDSPTRLILLDAGQEPRTPLRYQLTKGRREKVGLTLRVKTRMRGPGLPHAPIRLPAIKLVVTSEIGEKAGDQRAHYTFQFSHAELFETENVDPVMLNATRADLEKTVGVDGRAVVDTRGFVHDMEFALPKGMTPQMREILRDTQNSLTQMSPLPEEAVGIGARWQLTQLVSSEGLLVEQTVIYELTTLEGDRAHLKATLSYRADPQPAHLPGMPQGTSAELVQLDSKGNGEVSFDASRLLPPSARVSVQSQSEFRLRLKQSEQQMAMEAETTLELKQI
jgi:hypothetical protein